MVDSMTGRIAFLGSDSKLRARAVMEAKADDILRYAQDNAPWSDRTGDARDGLVVDVTEQGNDIYLELAHTVDYGQWLEVIQSGRFAIIMPTLELFAADIFEAAGAAFLGEEGGS
jgi:hypothetical protein